MDALSEVEQGQMGAILHGSSYPPPGRAGPADMLLPALFQPKGYSLIPLAEQPAEEPIGKLTQVRGSFDNGERLRAKEG